jgi:hypothetical protein
VKLLPFALLLVAGAARADAVVVELFTSQGCSSCPPADKLLPELAARPSVIALAFHVDYWDHLGWKDTFSSPRWSARQAAYAQVLGGGPYTPQLVVNGRAHVVGSDRARALAAIEAAARKSSVPVSVSARRDGAGVRVSYAVPARQPGDQVLIALAESGLSTPVPRGENRGRTLRNDFVVRDLVEGAGPTGEVLFPAADARQKLRVVVLVQARADREIRGAAAADL